MSKENEHSFERWEGGRGRFCGGGVTGEESIMGWNRSYVGTNKKQEMGVKK